MRIPRPRRKALWIGLGALALVLIAAGVLGLGLVRGWFDSGSVEGTTVGFEPAEAPRGQSDAGSWPEFGFDARRTRANPALDLPPPFRRRWSYDAGSLLEFPPVLADGRAIVGTNAGLGLAHRPRRPAASCGASICAGGWRRPPPWPGTWSCSPPSGAACWPSRRPPGARCGGAPWARPPSRRRSWSAARPTWARSPGGWCASTCAPAACGGRRRPRAPSRPASR